MMTESELNELGQTINRMLPKGAQWTMAIVPAHASGSHPDGRCPVQVVGNVTADETQWILDGVLGMFEVGTHSPMFARPVEQEH